MHLLAVYFLNFNIFNNIAYMLICMKALRKGNSYDY